MNKEQEITISKETLNLYNSIMKNHGALMLQNAEEVKRIKEKEDRNGLRIAVANYFGVPKDTPDRELIRYIRARLQF